MKLEWSILGSSFAGNALGHPQKNLDPLMCLEQAIGNTRNGAAALVAVFPIACGTVHYNILLIIIITIVIITQTHNNYPFNPLSTPILLLVLLQLLLLLLPFTVLPF